MSTAKPASGTATPTGLGGLASPPPTLRRTQRSQHALGRQSITPAHSRPQSPFYTDINPETRSRSRVRPGRPRPEVGNGALASKGTETPRSRNLSRPRSGASLRDEGKARFASPAPSSRTKRDSNSNGANKDEDVTLPIDERGQEMAPNARIWRIYSAEGFKADTLLTDGWNRSLDVLLVFTGLFSAVLTTFIIQSYQMIIANPGDATNALLQQIITLQQTASGVAPAKQSSPLVQGSTPSNRQAHWVNGLWFAALSFSLSAALVSMMAKTWLQSFLPNVSGTFQHRARQRQARLNNFESWHVPAVINSLPFLLHLALLLFFAGLVVLLWTTDLPVTLVTLGIVAVAYSFYLASFFLPMLYSDCPYSHPLAGSAQRWAHDAALSWTSLTFSWRTARFTFASQVDEEKADNDTDISSNSDEEPPPPTIPQSNDLLDAQAICWLLNHSTDQSVIACALQATAGLRRDFTAISALLEADALQKVEDAFQACFQKDTSVDLQWHAVDPDGAELYCRAWLKLTWGQGKRWPFELTEPLWILQDLTIHPDVAVVSSCAIALSSFNSTQSIFDLLACLADSSSGTLQISQSTQCILLDTICECVVRWEVPRAVVDDTRARAVPILIHLLERANGSTLSMVRSAAALALHIIVCGPTDLNQYASDELRHTYHCELVLPALSIIVQNPDKWGLVDAEVWDLAVKHLSSLATPIVAQSARFPKHLRDTARIGLTKVLVRGQLSDSMVSVKTFGDVLQVIYPLPKLIPEDKSTLVEILVEQLADCAHSDIAMWSVWLLERLLSNSTTSLCRSFGDANGLEVILRTVRTALVDGSRLSVDGLRVLFAYTNSLMSSSSECTLTEDLASRDAQLNDIFRSDFLDTLCTVVSRRRWWLFEVSTHWMPALQHLCTLRPREPVWPSVLKTFQDFADNNVYEEGYRDALNSLEAMRQIIWEYDPGNIAERQVSDS